MRVTRHLLLGALVGLFAVSALPGAVWAGARSVLPPTPVGPVPAGSHRPPSPRADMVLYDQTDNLASTGTNSQNYESTSDAFDDELADDFTVPHGQTWKLKQVMVDGFYDKSRCAPSCTAGPADSVNLTIYRDASGLPGPSIFVRSHVAPSSGLSSGNFTITFASGFNLTQGTYWLSVQANQNYANHGQWRWFDRKTKSGNGAAWQNPLNGFGIPQCQLWGARAAKCNLDTGAPDEGFQLIGSGGCITPSITSFSPTSGTVGSTITIKGTGFTGATSVTFGGTAAQFTVVNDTKITATVPPGATTGDIVVTTPCGTAPKGTFKVTPVITSFSPISGAVGTTVTIKGSGLIGTTSVRFNGKSATFSVLAPDKIRTSVPTRAMTGPISVTTPGGTATSATAFTVITGPEITAFHPTSGPVGTSVTITGSNFTGVTSVKFNGTPATFTLDSDAQITATAPDAALTGPIRVTTPIGSALSATEFKVLPTITGFVPASGPVGTSVTIKGTSFLDATGVKFNGTPAVFSVDSNIKITATVPAGATSGKIKVITPGGTAISADKFIVT